MLVHLPFSFLFFLRSPSAHRYRGADLRGLWGSINIAIVTSRRAREKRNGPLLLYFQICDSHGRGRQMHSCRKGLANQRTREGSRGSPTSLDGSNSFLTWRWFLAAPDAVHCDIFDCIRHRHERQNIHNRKVVYSS